MKSSMYRNLVVIIGTLGLLGLVAGCFGVEVSFESDQQDIVSTLADQTPQLNNKLDAKLDPATTPPLTSKNEISASIPNVTNKTNKLTNKPSQNLGNLRITNQTNQPVRLALLARQSQTKNSSSSKNQYNVPAHWDFDPQEGSEKGLILSLPEGKLKIEKGDVLVAFAQDGSRRYWGPYVVGETPSPKWNNQTQEWQLILTP